MQKLRPPLFSVAVLLPAVVLVCLLLEITQRPALASPVSGGSLEIRKNGRPAGLCPLRHTDVKAAISGFIARVMVTQDFENPSSEKIEAVYTFPLPQDAAVDDMTIHIGARVIRGVIKRREEAAALYAKAIQQGKIAALLDQERPNVFSQAVGNIPPGESVRVAISYLLRLKYEDGGYEFVFPMVVGPRYIAGTQAAGKQGGGWAPDTNQVPDASKITPPVAPPGTRAGHDISIALALDAGVPIEQLRSPSHQIDIENTSPSSAIVRLHSAAEIPNKDFVFRYNVAGAAIVEGVLTHTSPTAARASGSAASASVSQTNGYFTLIVQPPERFPEFDVTPKELVFVLDSSGSMNGFPEEKSKQLIDYSIDGLYPGDTFNVIKFSGDTAVLFDKPVYPSAENVGRAKEFVNSAWGGGGTEMMKAIQAALAPSDAADHVRIVVFLTDGEVGNDMAILSEIQKHPNARVFAYGIGSSVNRFLLDKMAEAGRGAVEYVSYKQDDKEAAAVAHRLYERLRAPLLTDIALDFGSLPVTDVYPRHIPDLFSGKPVVVTGRYTAPAQGTVRLTGKRAGDPYTREISVALPTQQESNPALSSLWAREKIDDLMSQDWGGLQRGSIRKDLREQITTLGLNYHLMTQFTSFVAVEERVVTDGGKPKRIQVPVELAEGVQYEQGWSDSQLRVPTVMAKLAAPPPSHSAGGVVGGVPGGIPGGQMGGVVGGIISSTPAKIAGGVGGGNASGSAPGIGAGYGGGTGGGVFRVGGGVSAPHAVSTPSPMCPATTPSCQGTAVLSAVVGENGKVREIRFVRSAAADLDTAVSDAVRQWKFNPAMKDGKPVAAQVRIEVAFAGGSSTTSVAFGNEGDGMTLSKAIEPSRSIDAKLHPQLVAAYDCWRAQADKSNAMSRCKLDSDTVLVQVLISGDPESALKQLKALGFEPLPVRARQKQLVGRIAVEKLIALTNVDLVQFVAPAARN